MGGRWSELQCICMLLADSRLSLEASSAAVLNGTRGEGGRRACGSFPVLHLQRVCGLRVYVALRVRSFPFGPKRPSNSSAGGPA